MVVPNKSDSIEPPFAVSGDFVFEIALDRHPLSKPKCSFEVRLLYLAMALAGFELFKSRKPSFPRFFVS